LTLTITGLPHHSRTPLWLALLLAGVIVAVGVWLAWSPQRAAVSGDDRQRLEAEQQERLTALAALETSQAAGRVDPPTYQAHRAALIAELERIYAALDESGGGIRRDVA
jgi:hypothetical protein